MFGEKSAHAKSTEMLTFASAFTLCFVLFIGMKLRWFRARMRFDANFIRTGSSSVTTTTTTAPPFSVAGVYRPFDSSSTNKSQVQKFYPKTEQKPDHHKSLPNLTENMKDFPTESSGKADKTMKTQLVPKQNLPISLKTERLSSNAEDNNPDAANFQLVKRMENRDIYSSTPDMLTTNNSQNELRQKKETTKNAVSTKWNIHETETSEVESGNLIFVNSNGKPISLVENKSTETGAQKTKTKTKTKSKAPAPPPPPILTNPKFHEYEEFDS